MNKASFELGNDVDVDDLMAHIRETVNSRKGTMPKPSASSGIPQRINSNEVDEILQEISRGGVYVDAINQIPLKTSGWKRRIERPFKKFLKWLVHWNTKSQAEFNRSLTRSLGLITQHLQVAQTNLGAMQELIQSETDRMSKASSHTDEELGRLSRGLDSLDERVNAESQRVKSLERMVNEGSAGLRKAIEEIKQEDLQRTNIDRLRLTKAIESIEKRFEDARIHSFSLHDQSFDYLGFEERFRGSLVEIKHRQEAYLDLFLEKKNVLDLGCGRGEFVELLSERGIPVTGVEKFKQSVEFCRNRGLQVEHADMFEYLSSLLDRCLDGVFTAQVVEHLPPALILKLFRLCGAKMKTGGIMVVETVNTNCVEALCNFYLDPTHVRPLPPAMLRFMVEQSPFKVRSLRFSSPLPGNNVGRILEVEAELPQEVNVYQDYAVVAVRV
jgi:2-polyprenyl-3-methyl-5-hydroxy-6-metoxy-1,4-benzoquinol methylase